MKRIITAFTAAALCPSLAYAATDGLLAQGQSQGDFEITLTIQDPETIIITGVEDAIFDYTIGDAVLPSQAMDLCIFTSRGTKYEIDIIADPLVDSSGATPEYYNYEVELFDNMQNVSVATRTITTTQQTIEPTTSLDPSTARDCTTPTAEFTVKLAAAPTVLTSLATGTIQLVVKPE
jgi:hypothetical protein